MGWLQLDFNATPETAPALESLLEEHGAVSVTMTDAEDQPLFEPGPGETPLWKKIIVTGLFTGDTQTESLIMDLATACLPDSLPEFTSSLIEEQDWQRAWMDRFTPMQFGERLWICPSWCDLPEPDAINILLDPGLAFGTGTHPTTSLCLEWLDQHDVSNQQLIDYGCGSGILGIAALLLGANQVLGVDNDPQALLASRDNAQRNSIADSRFPLFLPEKFSSEPVDGIMANILAEPLIQLAETLAAQIKPKGWIVLSGILEKQAQIVTEAYSPWFTVAPAVCKDGWVRLTAIKR